MSFVIAKRTNEKCLFIADTKVSIVDKDTTVTGNGKLRMPPEEGILKIHVLSPYLTVAFAGNVLNAQEMIADLVKQKPRNPVEYIHEELNRNNDCTVGFIIGTIISNQSFLYKVTKEKIECGNSFWIGEQEAFKEFQAIYNSNEFQDKEFALRAFTSFDELVLNTLVNTVGDFSLAVLFKKEYGYFSYNPQLFSHHGNKREEIEKGVQNKFTEGNSCLGSYIVSNLVSNNPNNQLVILYFQHANYGILFQPISIHSDNIQGKEYRSLTKAELKRVISEEYGVDLIGFEMKDGVFKLI